MKTTIGITCVGSGIGQSVVDALRVCGDSYRIIGFDLNPLSYGGLYCDAFYLTKPNKEPGYVDNLVELCKQERVQVLIPGLDSDLLTLSRKRKKFEEQGIKVLVSLETVIGLCRNKKRLSQALCSLFPEVIASYTAKEAREALMENRIKFPLIAKPIDGSGDMPPIFWTSFSAHFC